MSSALSAGMSRFARVMLFTLVALWLPSTMHCRLEAAGVLPMHEGCSEHTDTAKSDNAASPACADNICPTLESALYKDVCHLAVAAPHVHDCAVLIAAFFAAQTAVVEPALSPERFPPPLALAVTWQFSTRAAQPARAPGLNR